MSATIHLCMGYSGLRQYVFFSFFLLICTIMVGWIVCCVPSQMTSIFFPADKVCVAYYRLVMGFFFPWMLKEEVLMYSFPLMILFLCSIHVKFLINFIWIMKSKSLLTWYWEGIVVYGKWWFYYCESCWILNFGVVHDSDLSISWCLAINH